MPHECDEVRPKEQYQKRKLRRESPSIQYKKESKDIIEIKIKETKHDSHLVFFT